MAFANFKNNGRFCVHRPRTANCCPLYGFASSQIRISEVAALPPEGAKITVLQSSSVRKSCATGPARSQLFSGAQNGRRIKSVVSRWYISISRSLHRNEKSVWLWRWSAITLRLKWHLLRKLRIRWILFVFWKMFRIYLYVVSCSEHGEAWNCKWLAVFEKFAQPWLNHDRQGKSCEKTESRGPTGPKISRILRYL